MKLKNTTIEEAANQIYTLALKITGNDEQAAVLMFSLSYTAMKRTYGKSNTLEWMRSQIINLEAFNENEVNH